MKSFKQFTIYWCNLEPTFGKQMQKVRPCVIVSPNTMNDSLGTVVIVPMTSTIRKFPFYLPVNYHDHPGSLACDQIKVIDKRRIGKEFAALKPKDAANLSSILQDMFKLTPAR